MKPLKALSGLSKWILRIAILLAVFSQYYEPFMAFQISKFNFYVAAVFLIFAVLLLAGGFLSKHNLTVISSLFLMIASIYMCIMSYDGVTNLFTINLLIGAIAFFFVTDGNK